MRQRHIILYVIPYILSLLWLLFSCYLAVVPVPADAKTVIAGNWERGFQMISEEDQDLAEDAGLDSEYHFDRANLQLGYDFFPGVRGTVTYIHENKDYQLADNYDNVGNRIHSALTIPLTDDWKLKLYNRYWWKAYPLIHEKDNHASVTGAFVSYHPDAPWDFSLDYNYKRQAYDYDERGRYENRMVHTVIAAAARTVNENLTVNVRLRQKWYDFETEAALCYQTASIGFKYTF